MAKEGRTEARVDSLEANTVKLWEAVSRADAERRTLIVESAIHKEETRQVKKDLNGLGGRITRENGELAEQIDGAANRLSEEMQRIEKAVFGEEHERKSQLAETQAAIREAMAESVAPLNSRLVAVESKASEHDETLHSLLGSARVIIWLLAVGGTGIVALGVERAL